MIFHKILKNRLLEQVKLIPEQYAFMKNSRIFALHSVETMRIKGKTLTSVDISNAFNSINQEAVVHTLKSRGVNQYLIEYIKQFMESRCC